jgi:hypothetical protein
MATRLSIALGLILVLFTKPAWGGRYAGPQEAIIVMKCEMLMDGKEFREWLRKNPSSATEWNYHEDDTVGIFKYQKLIEQRDARSLVMEPLQSDQPVILTLQTFRKIGIKIGSNVIFHFRCFPIWEGGTKLRGVRTYLTPLELETQKK